MKLNKIAKAGIAIGLSAIIALSATGCGSNYSSNYGSTGTDSSYSQSYVNDYIDIITSNEFRVYDDAILSTPTTLNNVNYIEFLNKVNQGDFSFEYAEYYGLEEVVFTTLVELYNANASSRP